MPTQRTRILTRRCRCWPTSPVRPIPRLRALARTPAAGRVVVDLAAPAGAQPTRATRQKSRKPDPCLTSAATWISTPASNRCSKHVPCWRPVAADELRAGVVARPSLAVCLLVDRSGSMGGARLAAAAVAAACVAWRAPDDHSVVAFGERPLVVQHQAGRRSAAVVADDLLALRGFGRPTCLPHAGNGGASAAAILGPAQGDHLVVRCTSDRRRRPDGGRPSGGFVGHPSDRRRRSTTTPTPWNSQAKSALAASHSPVRVRSPKPWRACSPARGRAR